MITLQARNQEKAWVCPALLLLWTLSVVYDNLYIMDVPHKANCIVTENGPMLSSNNKFFTGILEVTVLSHTAVSGYLQRLYNSLISNDIVLTYK